MIYQAKSSAEAEVLSDAAKHIYSTTSDLMADYPRETSLIDVFGGFPHMILKVGDNDFCLHVEDCDTDPNGIKVILRPIDPDDYERFVKELEGGAA